MSKRQLPPDPDNENDNRALWAERAVQTFRGITGADEEDAICDLVCDLMHWCDRNKQDFANELRRAIGHYVEETDRKGEQTNLIQLLASTEATRRKAREAA